MLQRVKEGMITVASLTTFFGIIPSAATYGINALQASTLSPEKVLTHTVDYLGGSAIAYGGTILAELALATIAINGPIWAAQKRESNDQRFAQRYERLKRSGRI